MNFFHIFLGNISVEVPALDELYLGKNDEKMVEIKWKLFGWITSFSDEVISTMKNLPKKFLLISAILYALVKVQMKNVYWISNIELTY